MPLNATRDNTVLAAAIAQCNSSLDSGVIEECPPLQAVHDTDTATSCPYRNSQVQEQTTGLLAKIPGCIQITEGPARAAAGTMSCPSGVVPPPITPTQDSQIVIKKTGTRGQPFGLTGYVYVGCSNDSSAARVLGGPSFVNTTGMTVEACQQYCNNNHQKYSGVEFGQE
jgi:WSC domain